MPSASVIGVVLISVATTYFESIYRAVDALPEQTFLLLRRDPWLMSQTLMQLLYLVPPSLLLWRSFSDSATSWASSKCASSAAQLIKSCPQPRCA